MQEQVYAALAVQEQVEALGSILLLMPKLMLITQIIFLRLSASYLLEILLSARIQALLLLQ
ncbi:MAG: hypothetical protein CMJ25_32910 [Phycisphaerae bacterium]|nr:hypothetical protein [Phycisphaerae bacterium]